MSESKPRAKWSSRKHAARRRGSRRGRGRGGVHQRGRQRGNPSRRHFFLDERPSTNAFNPLLLLPRERAGFAKWLANDGSPAQLAASKQGLEWLVRFSRSDDLDDIVVVLNFARGFVARTRDSNTCLNALVADESFLYVLADSIPALDAARLSPFLGAVLMEPTSRSKASVKSVVSNLLAVSPGDRNLKSFNRMLTTPVVIEDTASIAAAAGKVDAPRPRPLWPELGPPRHSNDRPVEGVFILPPPDEVGCDDAPFLPQLAAADTPLRYREVLFRYLREEVVGSVRDCLRDFDGTPRRGVRSYTVTGVGMSAKPAALEVSFKWRGRRPWDKKRRLCRGIMVGFSPDNIVGKIVADTVDRQQKSGRDVRVRGSVFVSLATPELYAHILNRPPRWLVEADSSYFATEPILMTLKNTMTQLLPMEELLLHRVDAGTPMPAPPSTGSVMVDGRRIQREELATTPVFGFDKSQQRAFVLAMSSQVALIQGPPGTGKTYVGSACLKTLVQTPEVGPILIVTNGNRMLNELLVELKKSTTNIVRIGGSCPKDLDCFNFKNFKNPGQRARPQVRQYYNQRDAYTEELETLVPLLNDNRNSPGWSHVVHLVHLVQHPEVPVFVRRKVLWRSAMLAAALLAVASRTLHRSVSHRIASHSCSVPPIRKIRAGSHQN